MPTQRPCRLRRHGRLTHHLVPGDPQCRSVSLGAVARLVLIGVLAGLFSALLGVGGGTVVVPLLILTAGWEERPAMATSLAAVALISLVGAVTYWFHGEVKPAAAAVVGLPAVAGVVAGTALQQRLANRTLSIAFAALLAALGVRLLV
jgi:uncharacterized membrane protein YfcA